VNLGVPFKAIARLLSPRSGLAIFTQSAVGHVGVAQPLLIARPFLKILVPDMIFLPHSRVASLLAYPYYAGTRRTLLINGFGSFRSRSLRACLSVWSRAITSGKLKIFVYAHTMPETNAALHYSDATWGKIKAAVTVVPLTHAQAGTYRALGFTVTEPVYNTFAPIVSSRTPAPRQADKPLMVGIVSTIQPRKGYDRIKAVAQIALTARPNLRFTWVGPHAGGQKKVDFPENVHWMGKLDRPELRLLYDTFDIVALLSNADPLPLSIVEAMHQRKKVVISAAVGQAELIRGIAGIRVLDDTTPEKIIEAFDAVASEDIDVPAYDRVLNLFAPGKVAAALAAILQGNATVSTPASTR
jgi:glycosyltransferase involved in cell wall biosynthesis